ncbi:Orexin receptor type 2 [Holothuria leucospilota]|uniref:Orexin receptor type 2 n=1 Tax=Holothuria leucospilota TaxID=206669 RepID=A0A9Q1CCU7_HOLLE|nr:Orexin receptor type 2 [Holothuria leucospilota]
MEDNIVNDTWTNPLPTDDGYYSSTPSDESRTNLFYESPVLIQVIYYIIGITGIVGNSVVILVMYLTPNLHDVTNYIITNQSIIDLYASIVFVFNYVVWANPDPSDLPSNPFLAQLVCKVWRSRYIFWGCVRVSAANLMCLTMERYYAVCHAISYKKHVRKVHVIFISVFVWIFGYTYQLPMFALNNVHEDGVCRLIWPGPIAQSAFGISILVTQWLFPVCLMTYVYVKILKVLRNTVQPSLPPNTTDTDNPEAARAPMNKRTVMARRNVIKTLLIVAVTYVICWGPNFTFFAYFNVGGKVDFSGPYYFVGAAMSLANMAVNPFIYAFKYRRFQQGLLSLFRCSSLEGRFSQKTTSTLRNTGEAT